MVVPHPLAKETSLGAASSAERHPLARETSLGAASSEASGAGPAPDAFASGEVSLAKGKGPPGPRGCFRGSTISCPETRLELVTGVCEINAHPSKGRYQTRPPHIPNFNVAGIFGGLRCCEINAHFAHDEVLEQTANIEIEGCGGSSPQ
jgi:hypothetical protein